MQLIMEKMESSSILLRGGVRQSNSRFDLICNHTNGLFKENKNIMEGGKIIDSSIHEDQNIINKDEMCEMAKFIHFQSFESTFPFCSANEPAETFHHYQKQNGRQRASLSNSTFGMKEVDAEPLISTLKDVEVMQQIIQSVKAKGNPKSIRIILMKNQLTRSKALPRSILRIMLFKFLDLIE